jgi:DnaK suppressor protein
MTRAARRPGTHRAQRASRDRLLARYDETYTMLRREEAVADAIRGGLDTGPRDDVESSAILAQLNDEVQQVETLRSRLDELGLAVESCENGDYGYCEECGTRIPSERLAVQPAATRCVPCQEKVDASAN